jgi:sterol 3beta-glucosyltransferase
VFGKGFIGSVCHGDRSTAAFRVNYQGATMRITILTFGSRGDVQPYLALGLGLKAAGHQVCLAAHTPYETWIRSYGIDFAPLQGNPTAQHADPVWQSYHTRKSFYTYIRQGTIRFFLPQIPGLLADCWQACQGSDAIISTPAAGIVGFHIAEKLGVPYYNVWTNPGIRTQDFPHPYAAARLLWLQKRLPKRLKGSYNRLSYFLVDQLFFQPIAPLIQDWRRTLHLPPLSAEVGQRMSQVPTLYAYSPAVVPKPADWSDSAHVTGYWFLDRPAQWQPSPALVDFIQSGSPPVYIGFGSIIESDPIALTRLVVDGVIRSGQRAVLDVGWANLGDRDLPPQIYKVQSDEAPHSWLFPQMAALIHHGGAGTVAAGLRAGKPTVVVYSLITDYYFWGQRIADLGVGVSPLFRGNLSADRLACAIHTAVTDTRIQQRAAILGETIRGEDGIQQAVTAFHQHLPIHLRVLQESGVV